ncbi:MAG: tRNA lysidine(34) synthetase TilS [Pseudomonadota bacterium]|nr:tRNA lysidine(34) synthetase TilS [Pseudomonadota bacterium]
MSDLGPFEPCPHIAVALSGGSDSTAMLYLLRDWSEVCEAKITALIVDHKLRPNSTDEALLIQKKTQELGVECYILTWTDTKPSGGIQAAAREARYNLLGKWCLNHGVLHLLVGHTKDDQKETVFMRSMHGSGEFGLAGMAAQRQMGWGRIIRPCLRFSGASLRRYLQEKGLAWIEDPSNLDTRFERVRIRRELNNRVDYEELDNASLTAIRGAIERKTSKFLAGAAMIFNTGYATVESEALLSLPSDIAQRVLGNLCAAIGGSLYLPRRAKSLTLLTQLGAGKFPGRTLHGCYLIQKNGQLVIFREWRRCITQRIPADCVSKWDSRFSFRLPPIPGVSVGPLGDFYSLIKSTDVKNIPVPRPAIMALPAFFRGKTLLAVPHLDFGRSNKYDSLKRLGIVFKPLRPVTFAPFSVA